MHYDRERMIQAVDLCNHIEPYLSLIAFMRSVCSVAMQVKDRIDEAVLEQKRVQTRSAQLMDKLNELNVLLEQRGLPAARYVYQPILPSKLTRRTSHFTRNPLQSDHSTPSLDATSAAASDGPVNKAASQYVRSECRDVATSTTMLKSPVSTNSTARDPVLIHPVSPRQACSPFNAWTSQAVTSECAQVR
jgi:hypothetical protein